MKQWLLLAGAIVTEVTGTLCLRASVDHSSWLVFVVVTYVASFYFLGLTLRAGMHVGVAYGIWGACGVALVAIFGTVIFDEMLTTGDFAGIAAIIAGVVLVEMGSGQRPNDTAREVSA